MLGHQQPKAMSMPRLLHHDASSSGQLLWHGLALCLQLQPPMLLTCCPSDLVSQITRVNLHALPSTAKQASYHSGTPSSGASSTAQQLLESGVLGCVAGALPLGYTHPLVRCHHHLCSGPAWLASSAAISHAALSHAAVSHAVTIACNACMCAPSSADPCGSSVC
jgi:hypothetical protein